MVPSSNRLGNGPLKAEIGVRTSMESPVRRVRKLGQMTCDCANRKKNHTLKLVILADSKSRV